MSTKKSKPRKTRPSNVWLDTIARHAQAQADYRARNLEATREKARLRMQRRRAEIKRSAETAEKAAECRLELDAEYRERKRMRTYVDRYGLTALSTHYLPLKERAGTKYMPGILAEGERWSKTQAARSAEADAKRRIKASEAREQAKKSFEREAKKSFERSKRDAICQIPYQCDMT